MVIQETDEDVENQEKNKLYKELIQNKIGSDSYMVRGAQTLNLAQKTKNIHYIGFTQENKEVTASNWDIDDASKQEKKTEAEIQEIDYLKSIDDIMTEKLKNSKNLFDTDAPASHLSIQTSQASGSRAEGRSGTESSKKIRS
jgi:hypothetical protein